jgi:ACS family tartrate transporter-like MFS transporter
MPPVRLDGPATEADAALMRRITLRILPLLFAGYFMAYIDRVNVGFAALTMNKALGLSSAQYGFAAGLFFLSYFLFEVPSNLILNRVGARTWIARIMISWAIVSGLNAFVVGPNSFYLVRFLLGLAEAGFFPGLLFFLTLWYPARYRSRIISMLMVSTPFSIIVGSLVSTPILTLDGVWGLAGWQWLFVLQALPTLLLGLAILAWLPDGPAAASWLSPAEREQVSAQLALERAQRERVRHYSVGVALRSGTVWALALGGFGINAAAYGLILFLPQIVKGFGVGATMTGVVTAIPFAVAGLCMIPWARHSDATGERNLHACVAAALSGVALIVSIFVTNPVALLLLITLGVAGVFCFVPVFWAFPAAMLSGTAAAGGIALINAVANLSGFLGPFAMGWIKDSTGSFVVGVVVIGFGPILSAIVAFGLRSVRDFERVPGPAAGE